LYGREERYIQGFGGKNGEETTWMTEHRREDNIKIDLQEVGYGDMEWIDLVQDRNRWGAFVNALMKFRVP
jgi:hypothetical protein